MFKTGNILFLVKGLLCGVGGWVCGVGLSGAVVWGFGAGVTECKVVLV